MMDHQLEMKRHLVSKKNMKEYFGLLHGTKSRQRGKVKDRIYNANNKYHGKHS
jgi:hypothetical protein